MEVRFNDVSGLAASRLRFDFILIDLSNYDYYFN